MNNRSEFDDLKARIDLAALVAQTVELKRVGKNLMGICPLHDDGTASLSVNGQLWKCFGCAAGGDVVEWIRLKEKLEFPQIKTRMLELAQQLPDAEPYSPKPAPLSIPGLLNRVADTYHKRFKECPEAQQYLKDRGLDSKELWSAFRVGFCDGTMANTIPSNGPAFDGLKQVGLLNAKGREHFKGCIVVPLDHPDEGVVGFYGRKIGEDQVSHLFLPGFKRGVLQWQALKQASRVWVAESVLDAFSLWQAGIRDVTCLYGASCLHPDLENAFARFNTPEVVFCLDGDKAGVAATAKHARSLAERGLKCFAVHLPEGKDPNDLLRESGPAALKDRALNARPIAAEAKPEPEISEPIDTEEGFTLQLDGITYQLQLNAKLRGTLIARKNVIHSEKIDLHSSRSRMMNAGQLVKIFDISRVDADRHMGSVLAHALDWLEIRKASELKPLRPKAPELSEAEQAEALQWLKQPDLVASILQDCEALGFVGEEKAKLLAYLIGLSRKLPRPLSGIVMSQSGAGKSTLTEMVELLCPPEDVLLYSRLTPAALYYMDHNLTGLLLILEERAGGEAADYSIRTLQSRQALRLAVPIKDPVTGKITTQTYEVKGPVAYLETTTNTYLNPENASRCFELFMDETEAQTERIFTQQRLNREVPEFDATTLLEAIKRKHHNGQRMLKPLRVYVPYATRISFPSKWLRTRRDHERFLCLIEVIAFLHQHQREHGQTKDGKPYILANLDDYRLAYDLARDVLASTLHELTREGKELWLKLVELVSRENPEKPKDVIFTLKDVRQESNYSNRRLRETMAELVEMEYVMVHAGQNGRPFTYSVICTDVETTPFGGLTTPDELSRLLAA